MNEGILRDKQIADAWQARKIIKAIESSDLITSTPARDAVRVFEFKNRHGLDFEECAVQSSC